MFRLAFACLTSAVLSASVAVGVTFKVMSDLLVPVVVAVPAEPTPVAEPAPVAPDTDLTDVFEVQVIAPAGQTDLNVCRLTVGTGEPFLRATPGSSPWTLVLRRVGGQHVVIVAEP